MLQAAQIAVPGREILLNHELVEPVFGSLVVRYGRGAEHGLSGRRIGRVRLDLIDNSMHGIGRQLVLMVLVFTGGFEIGPGFLLDLAANPSYGPRS